MQGLLLAGSGATEEKKMCRNIKTLFNFEPPATEDEIHASALQFVRKLSGFNKPSQANAEAFDRAVGVSPAAADSAPHARAGARPRDRGREGKGAVEAEVRVRGLDRPREKISADGEKAKNENASATIISDIRAKLDALEPRTAEANNITIARSDAEFASLAKKVKAQTNKIDAAIADFSKINDALTAAGKLITQITQLLALVP
jgi:hypothetical protein